MVDDILSVQVNLEGPTQAATFKLYFQETSGVASGSSTSRLGDAFVEKMNLPLRNVLSNEWHFRSIVCRKHAIGDGTPYYRTASITDLDTIGTNDGHAVPANNALVVAIEQQQFSAKSHGRIFIPGLPEDECDGGLISQLFLGDQIVALATALATPFQDSPDPGQFLLGVISQKVLNAAPPAKDWEGAFAFASNVYGQSQLGVQRRRTTKTRGVLRAT